MYNNNMYNQQYNPLMYQQAYPYYTNYMQQQAPRQEQTYKPNMANTIQGKIVESLDVVKATEIPLDGSVSFFPLADGTAIITKQLQVDGTSKVQIYRPLDNEEKTNKKFVTIEDFNERFDNFDEKLNGFDNSDIVKDLQDIKNNIKEIKKEIEEIKKSNKEKVGKK